MVQMRILKCVQTGHVQITGGDAMIILCVLRFVHIVCKFASNREVP